MLPATAAAAGAPAASRSAHGDILGLPRELAPLPQQARRGVGGFFGALFILVVILAFFFVFFTARGPVKKQTAPDPPIDRTPVERADPSAGR